MANVFVFGNKQIKTYKAGRKCKHCKTLLNSYTPGEYCHAHQYIGFELLNKINYEKRLKAKTRQKKLYRDKAKEKTNESTTRTKVEIS